MSSPAAASESQAWVCPYTGRHHPSYADREGEVLHLGQEWYCMVPGCTQSSEAVRVAWCHNFIEHPDATAARCTGTLYFRPEDQQAKCVVCGAWCGRGVTEYLTGPEEHNWRH